LVRESSTHDQPVDGSVIAGDGWKGGKLAVVLLQFPPQFTIRELGRLLVRKGSRDDSMTIVPYEQLAPQTLRAMIEEFVTREGAVHGHGDISVEAQVAEVQQQLRAGKVAIVFDHETESCTIRPREDLARLDPGERRVVED
jgi:uncharacterized protein